jgi:mannosyltransferase
VESTNRDDEQRREPCEALCGGLWRNGHLPDRTCARPAPDLRQAKRTHRVRLGSPIIGGVSVQPADNGTVSVSPVLSYAAVVANDRRRLLHIVVTLGILGAAISVTGSWIPSLWGDEAASVMSAQRSIPSLFAMLGNVDAVHGTYYLGLHFWITIFGASPLSVRIPPAIAVGLTVASVVVVVGELTSARLALIAGLICCVLPRVTYMGEETRAYAFSAAFAGWSMWVLLRLLKDKSGSRRWWITYGVLMVVGSYAFLYFALFFAVHLIIILSTRPGRAFLLRWLWTGFAVLIVVSPLIVFAVLEQGQVAFLADQDTVNFAALAIGLWFSTQWFALLAWTLIIIGIAAHLIVHQRADHRIPREVGNVLDRQGRKPAQTSTPTLMVVALAWLAVPGLILLTVNLVKADFTGRYMSYSAPAAAILMTLGIKVIARGSLLRMVALLTLTATVAAPIYLAQRTPYAKNGSDWAQISQIVGAHSKPGDAIVFDGHASPSRRPRLALHTYPTGFVGLKDVTLKTPYQRSPTWYDLTYSVAQADARGRLTGIVRVWLVEYIVSGTPHTYGLTDLQRAGFSATKTYNTHSSEIIELSRG